MAGWKLPAASADILGLFATIITDINLVFVSSISMPHIATRSARSARKTGFLWLIACVLTACTLPARANSVTAVTIFVDQQEIRLKVDPGSTVSQVLQSADIDLGDNDKVEPALSVIVGSIKEIHIARIHEEFLNIQEEIPFQQKTILNESLPIGENRLVQAGENGLKEVTYRKIYEDNALTSSRPVNTTILKTPVAEILMAGVQEPIEAYPIPGRLVYLSGGNAWMMDRSTGQRALVVTSGDLDGRIFSISPDGNWLLYTRKVFEAAGINSLWVTNLNKETPNSIELGVNNIIHYADFIPGSSTKVAYSTVEPRDAAPGWQANNDLHSLEFDSSGEVFNQTSILSPNSGGIYGWWGTNYLWSSDRSEIFYSRPDSIGTIELAAGKFQPLVDIKPYQTNSSWAWISGFDWEIEGKIIYLTSHAMTTSSSLEETKQGFDLAALNPASSTLIVLAEASGIFSYPVLSPKLDAPDRLIAYLQADFPEHSDTSLYRLFVMDLDGSNRKAVFPKAGEAGIEPQHIVWSPKPVANGILYLGVIYEGNIWLVDSSNGKSQRITGDGLSSRIDWQ